MKKQRVVVVTGGGTGMGRAIALRFSENGDKVYVVGRRIDKLEETARLGKNIYPISGDVTDIKSIQQLKATILKDNASVDILINNAGGRGAKSTDDGSSLEEITEVWEQIIKLNLSSVFYVTQCFSDCISNHGGRIINISSFVALGGSSQGGVIGTAYAAAKSGIHGIDKTLAKSLGARGITINSIAPGFIDSTDFFGKNGASAELKERYAKSVLLGRAGRSEDIAAGAFYLASDEAGFITGEILNINGGVQFGR